MYRLLEACSPVRHMLPEARPSILHTGRRSSGKANLESADMEYAKEQVGPLGTHSKPTL